MKTAEEYLSTSRLFRHLRSGAHGPLVELYAARLVDVGLAGHGVWRCLNLVRDLLAWMASHRAKLTELDEALVERYLRHRGQGQTIQFGDRAALKRWLLVLRATSTIAPAALPPNNPQDQIFAEFGDYLRTERGLVVGTIERHRPTIHRFLLEVCPAGTSDLGKIEQEDVIRYVERHARDGSPTSGKMMCWSLRVFLRYLHHMGLNAIGLAHCVPSIRQWRFTSLPSALRAEQVQQVLDGCDRATAIGLRDYAILMMLAKLGLRAGEVNALTLDDFDWRAGEMLLRAKGRQSVRMPITPDVGAAVIAYLCEGRPQSACRRLFLRSLAPHIGFASHSAITWIAKIAFERVGIHGYAHQGAHIFRHSLASELLRANATLSEIGHVLRHKNHDTTRIYAKVDLEALRTLSLPWPGGAQ